MADISLDDTSEFDLHRDAATAHLGLLSSSPDDAGNGDWVVLIEDDDRHPIAVHFVALAFDTAEAPIAHVADLFRRSGYVALPRATGRPWAATWALTVAVS